MLLMSVEENHTSNSLALENQEDGINEKIKLSNFTSGDVPNIRSSDDSDGAENAIRSNKALPLLDIEMDPLIWTLPEPNVMEPDIDSVANNDDDDDEYNDGTRWGQPSSLDSLDDENGIVRTYKEERQKAMLEAMNGQFKILVSRLLASEGVPLFDEDGGNWLDIVTALSWEAALLIKPDVNEGRAMDPGSYIKVKCIASGSRSESQVIKGLVFKKNTAHKHMPTKFRNPRLLLLQGSLGHSAIGLSSFKSMDQEKDYLKSITDMIETCLPNVVFVEKTVSRDIQESLLAKGITLVFDMKLSRLERIARCTGSQIVTSADNMLRLKLKQCDSFHIEKFIEDYSGSGDGGKRPSKTLLFLEGFPKPLGCTILLKGAHNDELKKVKQVVHYTVFAAYHLILQTSFFLDQRAFFSDMNDVRKLDDSSSVKLAPSISCDASSISDIPISDGSLERYAHDGMQFHSDADAGEFGPVINSVEGNMHKDPFYDENKSNVLLQSDISVKPHLPGQLLSSVSSSLKKIIGDRIPPITSGSVSSYLRFIERPDGSQSTDSHVSPSLVTFDNGKEERGNINQDNPDNGIPNGEKAELDLTKSIDNFSDKITIEVQMKNKDDSESTLAEPESILVLFSSQCITKQMVCEQSHLSRIKYYGNFDVSLGRYLQDTLLSQKYSCSSCGEPSEAHVYRYTHQNGNLTVVVRCLRRESTLSGGNEGKIWMWTRCLKCKQENGIAKSTRRVVMSSSACGLSFGKFLELSFSSHSATCRLSKCGHSLHRDSLHFFGLGSKVAMFKYSPVEIYAICKPPPILEFRNPKGQEWLAKDARDVLAKGDLFFVEVTNLLQKLKPTYSSIPSLGSIKKFNEIEDMLISDKSEFQASLLKAINQNGLQGKTGYEIFDLNWKIKELLLMLCVWDQRLHSVALCTRDTETSNGTNNEDRSREENGAISVDKFVEEYIQEKASAILEASIQIRDNLEDSLSASSHNAHDHPIVETELEIQPAKNLGYTAEMECPIEDKSTKSVALNKDCEEEMVTIQDLGNPYFFHDKDRGEEVIPILDQMQENHSADVIAAHWDHIDNITDSNIRANETPNGFQLGIPVSQKSQDYKLEDPEEWIWTPFSELRKAYRKDLSGGFLQKFEFVNNYAPVYLSSIHKLINLESDWLHFPVGQGGDVISVIEDEISSVIAGALVLSKDQDKVTEGEGKGENDKAIDDSDNLPSNDSVTSLQWKPTGLLESEEIRRSKSASSFPQEETVVSGSDVSLFLDQLIASENAHPEVHVGSGKVAGKSKYSVVSIYAKQFHSLRRRCCSSEVAYISSLSRCKKWDAQGGKSKAFFAKTKDDRLIIKQIKKPELESFLKFGPDYFKHISLSLDSGSQTCLAKILGIYQVRQYKSGKEVKMDLLVMENLHFGRNISRVYDLKGAVLSRYISDSNEPGKVLLDENFVEDMRISPIYVGGKTKHLLQRAIWNDTSFLTSINVMDYSLLVGVDRERHEIVFGIIDYLRQYTWDKQLETWVKASLVVPKNASPTVISPKEYKKRFRKFMAKYFLTVPDSWSSDHCSG